jgi:2-methylisocitrate lyase-like PEP mutase family enzyme
MLNTFLQKVERYASQHETPGAFIAGGCWDVGSAMLLAHAGLSVLETSSAGVMFARGMPDGDGLATRDLMLENARSIAAAVDVPVTADLENGFGLDPLVVAETIRLAGETGIVGGSIEDTTGDKVNPILSLGLAVDRIRAAAEAARRLPFRFALTARADQYMHQRCDLAEMIQRAQAFQEAGADIILVPGLTGRPEIETLCRSVDCPVAVTVGLSDYRPNLAAFAALGVKRVTVGSSLARVGYTALLEATREMTETETFGFTERLMPFSELNDLFRRLHARNNPPGEPHR